MSKQLILIVVFVLLFLFPPQGGSALLALYQRNAVPVSLDRVRDEAAATPAKRKAEAELEPAQAEPEFQVGVEKRCGVREGVRT